MSTYYENWADTSNWYKLGPAAAISDSTMLSNGKLIAISNYLLQNKTNITGNLVAEFVCKPNDDLEAFFCEPDGTNYDFFSVNSKLYFGVIFEYEYGPWFRDIILIYKDTNGIIQSIGLAKYETELEYRVLIGVDDTRYYFNIYENATNILIASTSIVLPIYAEKTLLVNPGMNRDPYYAGNIGRIKFISNATSEEVQHEIAGTVFKAGNPTSSINSGDYYDEIKTIFNTSSIGALIYYTLDGTIPTLESSVLTPGSEITINDIGTTTIRAFASAEFLVPSDIVTFKYTIKEVSNYEVTNTSDTLQDDFPYLIEPTTEIGLQRYLDLDSITPPHLRNRPEIMDIIHMFQDYLNNAYKKIPHYETTISYTSKDECSSYNKTHTIRREPYNHNIDMEILRENNSIDLDNTLIMEEYNADRDVSTYIADPDKLNEYISKYNFDTTVDSYYYHRYKYYQNIESFLQINASKEIESIFSIFISTFDNYRSNNGDLANQFVLANEVPNELPTLNTDYKINLYFCDKNDFIKTFKYQGEVTFEPTFYPTFQGTVDNYNEEVLSQYAGTYTVQELVEILPDHIGRFRVSISGSGLIVDALNNISTVNMPITLELQFNGMLDFTQKMPIGQYPIMAPEFLIIKKWQDPETFYTEFSGENIYRIDDKKRSILDKIARIAFNKDPNVIDFEYIQYVAQQMGYNIGVEQEDIENNEHYVTKQEKEQALRNIIRTLPEFYKIKCTKNGLESILLSFGIVGEIIYLYTVGDNKSAGYADFVDSRLFESESSDALISNEIGSELMAKRVSNQSIASTVIDDWFPSPHFKVEIDLLKQNLRLDQRKLGLGLLNKAIKKTKPINTVFQGFYGTMISNFAYIFIHRPNGHMSAYSRGAVDDSCIVIDHWDGKCNSQ